ncbi:hypothetical protein ACOMHN_022558 [Nucella lapillus]
MEDVMYGNTQVPNTEVRANSVSLLLDAFPLQDHSANAEDTDLLIQKQFDLMQRLLSDPCPVVRGLTVEGVCRVVSNFLEVIPGEVVQTLLCKLLKELAWDTASPAVRLAVVKGVGVMLDNALCHLLLKPLVPGLSLCLHDKAETVRVAVIDLLLKVKGIRSIKYWTVAPVEHLLARLEADSQPVVRRIVELLFPSFLPLDLAPTEQVSRCLTLIDSNASAARVFFLNAPRHLTLTDTVKYMALLCRYVLESVRSMNRSQDDDDDDDNDSSAGGRGGKKRRDDVTQEKGDDDSSDDNSDDDNEDGGDDPPLTPETLQGLLEAIFLMWTAVAKQLDMAENSELKQSIMKKLSVTVPEVLKVTQNPKIIFLVVEIAGHLPSKAVPTISRGCLSKLRSMPPACVEADYAEILEAVCLWGMVPQVMQLISDWLEDSLTPTQAMPPPAPAAEKKKGKEGKKKCVQISVPEDEKRPGLALDYVKTLLRSSVCKRVLLDDHRPLLVTFNTLLSRVMNAVEKDLEQGRAENSERRTFLETVLSLHLCLTVLLHNPEEGGGDAVIHLKEVMGWGGRTLVPIMHQAKDDENDDASAGSENGDAVKSRGDFATACVLVMLKISSNMLMVGMGDREHATQLITFCRHLLNRAVSVAAVDQVLGCLHQALLFEELGVEGEVAPCMADVMAALNDHLYRRRHRHRSLDAKLMGGIKTKIQAVVTCVTSRHGNPQTAVGEKSVAIVTDLTSTMLSAVLAELQHGSQEDTLPMKMEDTADMLPPVSTCVLTCYSRNTPGRRLLVQEAERCVRSGDVTDVHRVHAIVHLLLAVHFKGPYHKDVDLKPVITAVGDMVQAFSQQTAHTHMDVDVDVYRDTMATIQTKLQSIVGNPC